MAYTKQTWADLPSKTTPINANRLTHIEDGIFNAAQTADTAASTAGTAAANVGIVSGKVETLTERVNGLDTAVSNKVDKVAGKGLSTNDYDNTDKGKVDSLGTASTKNSTSVVTESSDLVESGAVKDIVGWGNKNLLPNDMTTQTVNGITFSVQEDKSVIANGTASADWARVYFAFDTHLPVGDYLLSGVTDGAANTYRIAIELSDNTSVGVYDGDASFSIAQGVYITQAYVAIRMAGYVANNVVFKPMIRKATVTDSTYEPYHASVEEGKADNSVIGTVEGANASKAWSVGEHFIKDGQFKEVTQAIASGGAISDSNTVNKPVAEILTELKIKSATFSGTTSVQGNIRICNNLTDIILAVKFNTEYIFNAGVWYAGTEQGVHVVETNGETCVEKAVSGTYYYI